MDRPIGVFDSGVGGLTVVRALRALLPDENILYLGDTARVPYGSKSAVTVRRYTRACAQFLLNRGAKLVLIACNTASAYGLRELANWLPVPVIDAVTPGAKAAVEASQSGTIAVLATRGTVASGWGQNGDQLEAGPISLLAGRVPRLDTRCPSLHAD